MQTHQTPFSMKHLKVILHVASPILVGIGGIVQTGIYLFLPVFAPYILLCTSPFPTEHPGCIYISALPGHLILIPQTALQMVLIDKLWILPILFILVLGFTTAASFIFSLWVKMFSASVLVIWSGYSAYLITQNIPVPNMQSFNWHMFIFWVILGFVFQVLGLIGSFILNVIPVGDILRETPTGITFNTLVF